MLCCRPVRADTYGWQLPPVCVFFWKKKPAAQARLVDAFKDQGGPGGAHRHILQSPGGMLHHQVALLAIAVFFQKAPLPRGHLAAQDAGAIAGGQVSFKEPTP